MLIEIPDELYKTYVEACEGSSLRAQEVIRLRLEKLRGIPRGSRFLVVEDELRRRIEASLGGGHLKDAKDLAERVEKLARVEFEGMKVNLTPTQMEALKRRAEGNRRTLQDEIAWCYTLFCRQVFNDAI